MNHGSDPPADSSRPAPDSSDPYQRLGIEHDAGFEAVQVARQTRLEEVGDDPMARSRIEAAYDAVLMDRLKERQQGRVSSAARSASQREQASPPPNRPLYPALPSLPSLPVARLGASASRLPTLTLATGREFWLPLVSLGLLTVLLLLPNAAAEVLLSLAAITTVLNLQRRNGRFLAAVGWTLALLVVGLLLGSLLVGALPSSLPLGLPIAPVQLQSLPAMLLLLLGALLIA
jgi:hypothetical protein